MEPTDLYQLYKHKLLNICKQYAREEDVAEDLLHDAFVIILTSLDKLEDPDKLESWMTSIVRNVGYHYRQHAQKEQSAIRQLAKENLVTHEPMLTPDYDQLQSLVTQLPLGYQKVFRLSVFEGLSHQEISQLLGIAPHSSSSQLSHAKRMLRHLVKMSWGPILLIIAIPMTIWLFTQKKETNNTKEHTPIAEKNRDVENPHDAERTLNSIIPQSAIIPPSVHHTISLDTSEGPDSIYQTSVPYVEAAQEINDQVSEDTTKVEKYHKSMQNVGSQSVRHILSKDESPWRITLSFSGLGHNDDYMAQASVGKSSFDALSNLYLTSNITYSNWIDYKNYLNYSPTVIQDAETRSIMNIAEQNSVIKGGDMEAHYEHKQPITIQILLNRKLSRQFSLESGLSYTQLSSIITTGSALAYIQEKQRLRYLGIPIRINWQWYSRSRFSLYSSVGAMFELPIHCTLGVTHISNGINTFNKSTTLDVSPQWSTILGGGLQYQLSPHIGLYAEPTLQFFFDDGSDIQSYRTEHPLQITLPLGIRFQW